MIKKLQIISKVKGGVKIGNTTFREYTGKNGFYAWLNLSTDSIIDLNEFFKDLKFKEDELLDMHCTIMYSKEAIPQKYIDKNKQMPDDKFIQAISPISVDWWEGHDKDGYLVLKLDPTYLQPLHDKWKKVGAKPSFNDYTPHITLRTGLNENEAKKLIEKYNKKLQDRKVQRSYFKLTLLQEQIEDLED